MSRQNELRVAQSAALSAGHYLEQKKCSVQLGDTSGRDVKLPADREAEKIILEILNSTYAYPILAEESGESGNIDENDVAWIVDPLDGTLNYSRELGLCAVSIALFQGFTPLLGVVYDFNRHELFSGIVGLGADCNGKPLCPSPINETPRAVLATGFPVNRDFASASLQAFLDKVQRFKKIRLLGSAALSLAYVACGRVDAYIEEDIMLWDVGAGLTLAQAAGAWTSINKTGLKPWSVTVKASGHPSLFNTGL